jgi:hypothetical protein
MAFVKKWAAKTAGTVHAASETDNILVHGVMSAVSGILSYAKCCLDQPQCKQLILCLAFLSLDYPQLVNDE